MKGEWIVSHSDGGTTLRQSGNLREIQWSECFRTVEQMEDRTGSDYSELREMLAHGVLKEIERGRVRTSSPAVD